MANTIYNPEKWLNSPEGKKSMRDYDKNLKIVMKTFKVTEKWWVNGNIPICFHCYEEIFSPKQLRMYESKPYHPDCFKIINRIEEKSELMKKYWERVLALDFQSK
jgi:hypothetical protein